LPNPLQLSTSYGQIIKIAAPIGFAILVPQLNFITNNIFLARLDEASLSAGAITGVYYLIFAAIGFALNNALQALIARRAGENRPSAIGQLFTQGTLVAMVIALVGITITYTLAPFLLTKALHDGHLAAKAILFLKIRIWGLPFLYLYQMRNALLVGINQSKYLIAGTIAEAVANVLFDYGFIFGKMGLPLLGFNGAAVASVLSEFIGMIVVFAVIRRKGISQQFSLFGSFKYEASIVKLIVQQASPLVFQNAISIISWELFYILIERNGGNVHSLSVSNVMRNFFGLFGVFSWALAATANAMVSNIIGQGLQEQVPALLRKIVTISTSIALFFCLALNLFPETVLGAYGQTQEWIEVAKPVARVVSVALVLMSFSIVCLSAVTGTGNSKISLLIEIPTLILYCLYVFSVLELWHKSVVIGWMSEWLYWMCLFTGSFIYLRSGKWKGKII
jgi:multidrug resistance protein, MATE family